MFSQDRRLALFDGVVRDEAGDEFLSVVVMAHEQALKEGITPADAIAVIVDWASSELARCMGSHHIVD